MKDYSRSERVAEQVKDVLAVALLREIQDPRLQNISIMAVHVSEGLELARIFWLPLLEGSMSERERKRAERAFETATPFLRGKLAKALKLRIVPELRFEYDDATEHGRHMEQLIQSVLQKEQEHENDIAPSSDPTPDDDQNA